MRLPKHFLVLGIVCLVQSFCKLSTDAEEIKYKPLANLLKNFFLLKKGIELAKRDVETREDFITACEMKDGFKAKALWTLLKSCQLKFLNGRLESNSRKAHLECEFAEFEIGGSFVQETLNIPIIESKIAAKLEDMMEKFQKNCLCGMGHCECRASDTDPSCTAPSEDRKLRKRKVDHLDEDLQSENNRTDQKVFSQVVRELTKEMKRAQREQTRSLARKKKLEAHSDSFDREPIETESFSGEEREETEDIEKVSKDDVEISQEEKEMEEILSLIGGMIEESFGEAESGEQGKDSRRPIDQILKDGLKIPLKKGSRRPTLSELKQSKKFMSNLEKYVAHEIEEFPVFQIYDDIADDGSGEERADLGSGEILSEERGIEEEMAGETKEVEGAEESEEEDFENQDSIEDASQEEVNEDSVSEDNEIEEEETENADSEEEDGIADEKANKPEDEIEGIISFVGDLVQEPDSEIKMAGKAKEKSKDKGQLSIEELLEDGLILPVSRKDLEDLDASSDSFLTQLKELLAGDEAYKTSLFSPEFQTLYIRKLSNPLMPDIFLKWWQDGECYKVFLSCDVGERQIVLIEGEISCNGGKSTPKLASINFSILGNHYLLRRQVTNETRAYYQYMHRDELQLRKGNSLLASNMYLETKRTMQDAPNLHSSNNPYGIPYRSVIRNHLIKFLTRGRQVPVVKRLATAVTRFSSNLATFSSTYSNDVWESGEKEEWTFYELKSTMFPILKILAHTLFFTEEDQVRNVGAFKFSSFTGMVSGSQTRYWFKEEFKYKLDTDLEFPDIIFNFKGGPSYSDPIIFQLNFKGHFYEYLDFGVIMASRKISRRSVEITFAVFKGDFSDKQGRDLQILNLELNLRTKNFVTYDASLVIEGKNSILNSFVSDHWTHFAMLYNYLLIHMKPVEWKKIISEPYKEIVDKVINEMFSVKIEEVELGNKLEALPPNFNFKWFGKKLKRILKYLKSFGSVETYNREDSFKIFLDLKLARVLIRVVRIMGDKLELFLPEDFE